MQYYRLENDQWIPTEEKPTEDERTIELFDFDEQGVPHLIGYGIF